MVIALFKVSQKASTRSRRGMMDGLRSFFAVDSCSAVDVGGLRRGTTSLQVQKPQFSGAFPGVIIRGSADDLTLRAEEVGMQRASSTQSTVSLRGGDHRWLTDWHAFCQAI